MNSKRIVKLSNTIGIVSIILLVYWVFVFMTVEVFGLKVFRENITETFYLSILGILALMFGALIINIMFNLTRIAQKHNQDSATINSSKKKVLTSILILSFPILFGLLFGGDYLSSKKKEKHLISSAESIIDEHSIKTSKLLKYDFSKNWIRETQGTLSLLSKTDKNFPHISVLVRDTVDGTQMFLGFREYVYFETNDTIPPRKENFIIETTKEEREYLNNVFDKKSTEIRFSAHDGDYQLFYPYEKDSKLIILYFSDYKRYGKIGS